MEIFSSFFFAFSEPETKLAEVYSSFFFAFSEPETNVANCSTVVSSLLKPLQSSSGREDRNFAPTENNIKLEMHRRIPRLARLDARGTSRPSPLRAQRVLISSHPSTPWQRLNVILKCNRPQMQPSNNANATIAKCNRPQPQSSINANPTIAKCNQPQPQPSINANATTATCKHPCTDGHPC